MIKRFVYPVANKLVLQPAARILRGMTLGVRGVAMDKQGRFLVVQQSYTAGWIFPGGGVERGETALEALAREMDEEAGVKVAGKPDMLGLYSNHAHFPGDYVAVYLVREYSDLGWKPSMEISARAFLSREEIEKDCTDAMRRRLSELCDEANPAGVW